MSVERSAPRDVGRNLRGPRLLAIALVGFALVALYAALQIRQGGGYSAVGPRVFPLAVAAGLLVLAVIFLLRTTVWPDRDLAERAAAEDAMTHWWTVGELMTAMVVYVFALRGLGYVVATMLFFAAGAWVLGSRGKANLGRNLAIGLVLGLVIYFGFTRFLGVRLPAGLLDLIL